MTRARGSSRSYGSWINNKLPVSSVPITTKVVSLNTASGKVYSMKFVSDLRQVCGFLWVL